MSNYLFNNYFVYEFGNNFSALLLCKINVLVIFEMGGFCFLTKEAMFSWKKNSRYYCQSTENGLKRREIWFSAGVRRYACVCMCVCARLSNFQTTIIHKRLEISSWNLVRQWSSHAPSIVTTFMQIDAQFEILWYFEFFWKMSVIANFL